jgi:alpha-tubulin suppressor-like RCC1 family protein
MVHPPTSPRTVNKLRVYKRQISLVHNKNEGTRIGPPGRRFYTWGWNPYACLGAKDCQRARHTLVDKPARLQNEEPLNKLTDEHEVVIATHSGRTVLSIANPGSDHTQVWTRGSAAQGQLGVKSDRRGKRVLRWQPITRINEHVSVEKESAHPSTWGYRMHKHQDYVAPKNYTDVNWTGYAELSTKVSPVFFDYSPAVDLVSDSTSQRGEHKTSASTRAYRVQHVFAGHNYSLAVPQDGSFLLAWGSNNHGQLCLGSEARDAPKNRYPNRPMLARALPHKFNVARLGLGRYHVLAVGTCGRVFGWGDNRYEQLGCKNEEHRPGGTRIVWEPRLLDLSFDGTQCSAVDATAGEGYSIILLSCRSRMLSCGRNDMGQLGRQSGSWTNGSIAYSEYGGDSNDIPNTSFAPISIRNSLRPDEESIVHIHQIVAGRNHTVALVQCLNYASGESSNYRSSMDKQVLSKPKVVCWGDNTYGQLGLQPSSIGRVSYTSDPTIVADHTFAPISKVRNKWTVVVRVSPLIPALISCCLHLKRLAVARACPLDPLVRKIFTNMGIKSYLNRGTRQGTYDTQRYTV